MVTTTDGRRWQYNGSGDKGLEASYTELADVTPDWSAIAGKPASFPPAVHTHTLSQITDAGTMAGQNAGAVNISGGTIAGVVISNATMNNVIISGGTY